LDRFKSSKIIKNLNTSLDQNQKMLEALKIEIDALKAGSPSEPAPEAAPIINEEKDPDAS
jgi:hypothetical protein